MLSKSSSWAMGSTAWLLLGVFSSLVSLTQGQQQRLSTTACSLDETFLNREDPNLHLMEYDVGDGLQTTQVYIEPDVTTFYADHSSYLPSSQKVTPKFNGLQAKFVNLSNDTIVMSWEESVGGNLHVMRHLQPWEAAGTASFPGHRFVFTPLGDAQKKTVLQRMIIQEYPNNLYFYDPYDVRENPTPPSFLKPDEKEKYTGWRKTMLFNEQYRAKTGRSYLANYLRKPPSHFMWPADHFGQEHWITSKETQFMEIPPQEKLEMINIQGKARRLHENEPRLLSEYRDPSSKDGMLNMTLRVLSVAPRVFEISNFLSSAEVQHVLDLADQMDMQQSSTGDEKNGRKETTQLKTRTSYNTWVPREQSPIIDAIYRRAADLERIDEALLRIRDPGEYPERPHSQEENSICDATRRSIAEHLQLVRYAETQEYTAHHDFGFAKMDDEHQGARFSTLLLYLNEPEEGGETSFPRWSNAETFKELVVKPEIGKAVLFYSQLPDGNMDDLSQHAAKPVIKGRKMLMNAWIWDPVHDV